MPCNHLTKDGTPCGMAPLAGEPFCWNHSSSVASVRAKARQRGGAAIEQDTSLPRRKRHPASARSTRFRGRPRGHSGMRSCCLTGLPGPGFLLER